MATYSDARAIHATLTSSTVDTVTITGLFSTITVLNEGPGDIDFTYGTTPATPTVGGAGTERVPAGASLTVQSNTTNCVVKLIGPSASVYSVEGL